MQLPDGSQARSWEGRDVVDSGGQPLGRCTGVFADTATGVAEWLDVDVEGHGRSFVPAVDASGGDDGPVQVRFSRDAVLAAPSVGDEVQLSKAEEIELYRHYGVPVEATEEGSVLPADAATGAPAPEDAVVEAPVATATVPPAVTPTTAAVPTTEPRESDTTGADAVAPAAGTPAVTPAAGPPAEAPPAEVSAAPRLRRVQPVPPVPPVASPSGTTSAGAPSPSPSGGSSADLSAAAPLGAVAGVVALVALGLRARDARERRRTSPAARADRLRRSVSAGSSTALASAGRAASASTQHGAAALRATSADIARAAAAQRRATAKAAAGHRKAAAAHRKAAAKAAAAQRKQALATLAAATKAASAQRKAATVSLTSVSRPSGSRRSRSATSSATAVPRRVARRGRKVRRSIARKVWDTVLLTAAGGGYVLGAKAGRERYEELGQVASAVAGSPKVQSATAAVTDPERRSDLLLEVQQQASALVGRRGQRRS